MAEISYRTERKGRNILKDVIPTSTPYMFGFFLGDLCNFKCKYCIQSANEDVPEKKHLIKNFMEWDIFEKISNDLAEFPEKIKKILFTSFGEPLLNPHIVHMIKYLNNKNVADEYEIVTNAAKLNKEFGKELIDAGLTRLCVSLQGLTDEKYEEICGVRLNVQELVDNIRYFYEYGRGKCRVHVKIIDIALGDNGLGEEKNKFYAMFNDISDTMNVDKIMPSYKGVDYDEMIPAHDMIAEHILEKNKDRCCSSLFYTLYCNAGGG